MLLESKQMIKIAYLQAYEKSSRKKLEIESREEQYYHT